MRKAVDSRATVDQALGVLLAVYRFPPVTGFDVLREVSQRTNCKLHIVAQVVLNWALGESLPFRWAGSST
ncbi:ANTAR domain-containing protein [Streptomyces sp. NPDC046832]|uniref:ANTAR domain-containing protein n=1 Tax=Streptomyces sp. NPDC046832 TaxID=3155020 RepID=UPI0033D68C8F